MKKMASAKVDEVPLSSSDYHEPDHMEKAASVIWTVPTFFVQEIEVVQETKSPCIEETKEKSTTEKSFLRHKSCFHNVVSFMEGSSITSVGVKVIGIKNMAEMTLNGTTDMFEISKLATGEVLDTQDIFPALERKTFAFHEPKQVLVGLLQLYDGHEVRSVTSNLQQKKFYKGWKFKYKPLNFQRKHDSRDVLQLILDDSTYQLKHKGRVKHLQPVSDSVLGRRIIEQMHQGHRQWFLKIGEVTVDWFHSSQLQQLLGFIDEQRSGRGLQVVSMLRGLGIGCEITVSSRKKHYKNWWFKYKRNTLR